MVIGLQHDSCPRQVGTTRDGRTALQRTRCGRVRVQISLINSLVRCKHTSTTQRKPRLYNISTRNNMCVIPLFVLLFHVSSITINMSEKPCIFIICYFSFDAFIWKFAIKSPQATCLSILWYYFDFDPWIYGTPRYGVFVIKYLFCHIRRVISSFLPPHESFSIYNIENARW